MAKVLIKTVTVLDNGTEIKNEGIIDLEDQNLSQLITLEYASLADGGPVMRPNNPPTW